MSLFNEDDLRKYGLWKYRKYLEDIILNIADENQVDFNKKEIGDRVIILTHLSLTHLNGEELTTDELDELFLNDKDSYYIVVDVNQEIMFKGYIQDAIVVDSKTNQKFRVDSKHLRVV